MFRISASGLCPLPSISLSKEERKTQGRAELPKLVKLRACEVYLEENFV